MFQELVVKLTPGLSREERDATADAISMIRGVEMVGDAEWHNVAVCWLMDTLRPYLKKLSKKESDQLRAKMREGVARIAEAQRKRMEPAKCVMKNEEFCLTHECGPHEQCGRPDCPHCVEKTHG